MARPSLKTERSEEILDAFTRCIARYGLDGSTLARISEEAGVGRPLLRHYLGNRDQMVERVLAHVMARFEQSTDAIFASLPATERMQELLAILFAGRQDSSENAAVFQALVAASDRYVGISDALMGWVSGFEAKIAVEVRHAYKCSDQAAATTAAGISAIYFNTYAIMPLGPQPEWLARQRSAVDALLAMVATDT